MQRQERESTTPAELLWTDETIYVRRVEKSVSALLAVETAIRRARPLQGGETEFLELFDRIADSDPELLSTVWRDPTAYFWVRMAYQLVATCVRGTPLAALASDYCADLGTDDPRRALATHLSSFKAFVLGLHVVARSDVRFSEPLDVGLPFAIPGTSFSLVGDGSAKVSAIAEGRLAVEHGGATHQLDLAASSVKTPAIGVAVDPVLAAGPVRLRLQPAVFNLPGLRFARALRGVSREYQIEHAPLLRDAIDLVARFHSDAHRHLGRLMQVVALKPYGAGGYSNLSHSDLPGAAICGVVREPLELADTLIHELFHNRFFFIEESGGAFFRDARQAVIDGRYYSPWRPDLRPLHGVLHGLYVYLPVGRFWLAVYGAGGLSAAQAAYTADRVVRIPRQVRIAVRILRTHGDFTDFGARLFDEIEREVERLEAAANALGLPGDVAAMRRGPDGSFVRQDPDQPMTVDEAVRDHVHRYDVDGQSGERAPGTS